MPDSEFTVTRRTPEVAARVHQALALLVARKVEEVAARAGGDAPVDTSSLAQSYYFSAHGESGYAAAAARAEEVNPRAVLVPEASAPADDLEGVAASAVQHAVFVELGTVKTTAQPHFLPALEQARAELPGEAAGVVRQAVAR